MPTEDRGAERLPPHDENAEKSVLGSMLRDNRVIAEVVRLVRAEDFYKFAHQKLFQAMTTLAVDKGHPVDAVTLANHLKETHFLEDAGGYGYIIELWDAAPSAANAEYYADIVRQRAIARNLIHACTELSRDAFDQVMPSQELLDQAEKRILEIAQMGVTGDTKTLHEAIIEAYDRLEARAQQEHHDYTGVPTGFIDLDTLTAGFQASELIIIAARPSVGKTAFALNIARHVVVEENMAALFVSLEQSRVELAERLICCQAKIDSHSLRRGQLARDDRDKLISAGDILRRAQLFIDDTPGQSMLRISANARRLKLKHDIRLVVIDYMQLIDPDNRRDSRQEQVAVISRRLKFLARELEIPVVALSQLNRSPEDRKEGPKLSDLRESGSIEQDADTVLLLSRENEENHGPQITIKVDVAKQRNGPTDVKYLIFIKQYMRFENAAVDHSAGFGEL